MVEKVEFAFNVMPPKADSATITMALKYLPDVGKGDQKKHPKGSLSSSYVGPSPGQRRPVKQN